MSEYYPVCHYKPCPICGNTTGNCETSEYGYVLVCYGRPSAQEGTLAGTWKCFRSTGEYSQWEDQRIALEARYQERKVRITFVNADGQAVDTNTALNRILERLSKEQKHGGKLLRSLIV